MINLRLLLLSILALIFLILAFLVNPWFIAGSVILVLINQKEILNPKNKKR
jgi:hypothetical protein